MEKSNTAPDFVLQSIEGQSIPLHDSLQGNSSVLLIFLRHLG